MKNNSLQATNKNNLKDKFNNIKKSMYLNGKKEFKQPIKLM